MFRFVILALALVAASNAAGILGGITTLPGSVTNDAVSNQKLQEILNLANDDSKVKSIDAVRMQVVSGLRFIVDFTTEEDKKCTASWVDAPWKTPRIQNVEVKCQ